MKNTRCILLAVLLILLAVGIAIPLQIVRGASPDYSAWNDLGIVYTPPSGAAYYPSVLYDVGGFGGGSPLYKMWYSDGSGGVFVVSSMDGLTWGSPVLANGGLSGNPNHVQVLYDSNCFGAASCGTTAAKYRIWYEDTANLYSISALATGSSTDGVNWTASVSGPVAQSGSSPLVTAAGWSRGTYGPISLSYQASATNTGTDPWNYSYVMFFDGTTGAVEATGLAYSVDGLTWTADSSSPVLDIGGGGAWDANFATFGTVLKTGALWSYWYSGGVLTSHEGIGYASSSDGKSWSKAASNPIFSVSQGVSHRNQRVYTPSVLVDGNGNLRMYYSAVGTDGIKKIGLALLAPTTVFVDASWKGLAVGTPVTFPGDPTIHTIGLDAFDQIQEGINAVLSSGTVKVAPGMYKENITISKPLTLQSSSGPNSTFIDASITGNPYVVFISSKNVTLDGFDISSPGYTGSSDASGVVVEPSPYVTGANVRITNNIIHDIGTPTRTSVSFGNVGVNIGMADGVEVDHNQIYNIIHADPAAWANGISIWGNGPSTTSNDISIHDNSFHDISSPDPADADISTQTDVGMNVVVYNNSIISTAAHPTEFGVQVLSSNIVDARHNWWGDPSGPSGVAPGHGSAITVHVLYDPWLTDASGTPGTPGTGSAPIGIPGTGFDPMWIPGTGFAPLKITQLKSQPADKAYSSSETQLEIPALNLSVAIVGVPRVQNNWDVTWLGNRAGYLEGTAFPTLPGNSAIAGHIYNSDGKPGPFVGLNLLRYGDEINILTWGKKYIYQVRENRLVTPDDQSVFKHEEYSWITLLTCQDYDQASNTYRWRRAVRAVLIQIAPSP